MRVLDIPPFPRRIEIPDLEHFLGSRIRETIVLWPNQAVPLLGAMCHPNDGAARETLMGVLRSWLIIQGLGTLPFRTSSVGFRLTG